ncbi:GntR family transcriptional regulator [Cryptosporangium aurantiacum]|uniref:Transcriptional regulator, GntR family n=1 Tax=Cryptosporangium aurantiacum TaxID=134849 RepID=A0A1M7R8T1_9ACTN|nr:GntR family transcriptional regulator [Cryptosporangium aurantiacum]SHN42734.1 transcriptional regulator, GntR family [Cryptosporangium aurantiacum]
MADPNGSLSRPESLSRQIYATLREGIIRGQYAQGSRLAEQRLAEELAVSRVPLREAVPLLEMDGFVRTLPRRGTVVSTWSLAAAHDLFDLRLCLDVGAATYAARQVAAGASTELLAAALERSAAGAAEGDRYRIAQTRSAFHDAIVDLTGNALMATLMRPVSGRMTWLFYLTAEPGAPDPSVGNSQLYRAITSGNERVAEAVAYARIECDRRESLDALRRIGVE